LLYLAVMYKSNYNSFALFKKYFRELQNFIGFDIKIRIVSEVAGNGSANAEPKTSVISLWSCKKTYTCFDYTILFDYAAVQIRNTKMEIQRLKFQ
jgi:hypothetical protein